MIPENESALAGTNRLVKDRSRKSGSIQDHSLTKLTPGFITDSHRQTRWKRHQLYYRGSRLANIISTILYQVYSKRYCCYGNRAAGSKTI